MIISVAWPGVHPAWPHPCQGHYLLVDHRPVSHSCSPRPSPRCANGGGDASTETGRPESCGAFWTVEGVHAFFNREHGYEGMRTHSGRGQSAEQLFTDCNWNLTGVSRVIRMRNVTKMRTTGSGLQACGRHVDHRTTIAPVWWRCNL